MKTTASDPDAVVVVLTTLDSEDAAARLAHRLVDEGLVACVNLIPGLRSIYRWQGKVEDAGECLLVMKSARHRLDALRRRVHDLHGYDTPEWVVIETAEVSRGYRDWLLGQLSSAEPGPDGQDR